MSQTSVRLIDFPRLEGSTRDVNIQSPQEPQADQTTADAVCQARHRCRSVAQSPLLNHPRGKINRSTLPSQVIRFSGQKLRSLIPDCCRISLRGNRRYEVVRTVSLTPRDFHDWRLKDCQTWKQELLAMLAKGRIAALRHAVQHVMHERPRQVWDACLVETARALEAEAEHTLRGWPCLQRAHTDPAVRERLATLLRLDSINRQAGLQPYLTTHLQCPPADVHDVMASIRYDSVAAKLLALMPDQSAIPPVPSR